MADIEDLGKGNALGGRVESTNPAGANVPSVALRPRRPAAGTRSVLVRTWGCGHNVSDGETIAGVLQEAGYHVVVGDEDTPAKGLGAAVLNSCTVKGPSQQSFERLLESLTAEGVPVVVAGCVPSGAGRHAYSDYSAVSVTRIDRVAEAVAGAIEGEVVRFMGKRKGEDTVGAGGAEGILPSLDLPKVRRNPLIETVTINAGCLNRCTYCKTRHARGALASWRPSEIVDAVSRAVADGVREIRMSSEDTGAYGHDIGVTIADLLERVVEVVPDGAMVRVGMTNPPYILRLLPEIARWLSHERVFAFLHVPVQSGSDPVLESMKRGYTAKEFLHVVEFLREHVPGITIATDIICGFPGEREDDHIQTVEMLRGLKLPVLHVTQFYPRPGTPAASMKQVPSGVKKARSRELSALFASYVPDEHERLVGTVADIWITEIARDGKHYAGRTKGYVQCLIPIESPARQLMGKRVRARITRAIKFAVFAEVVSSDENAGSGSADVSESKNSAPTPKQQGVQKAQAPQASSKGTLLFAILAAIIAVALAAYGINQPPEMK